MSTINKHRAIPLPVRFGKEAMRPSVVLARFARNVDMLADPDEGRPDIDDRGNQLDSSGVTGAVVGIMENSIGTLRLVLDYLDPRAVLVVVSTRPETLKVGLRRVHPGMITKIDHVFVRQEEEPKPNDLEPPVISLDTTDGVEVSGHEGVFSARRVGMQLELSYESGQPAGDHLDVEVQLRYGNPNGPVLKRLTIRIFRELRISVAVHLMALGPELATSVPPYSKTVTQELLWAQRTGHPQSLHGRAEVWGPLRWMLLYAQKILFHAGIRIFHPGDLLGGATYDLAICANDVLYPSPGELRISSDSNFSNPVDALVEHLRFERDSPNIQPSRLTRVYHMMNSHTAHGRMNIWIVNDFDESYLDRARDSTEAFTERWEDPTSKAGRTRAAYTESQVVRPGWFSDERLPSESANFGIVVRARAIPEFEISKRTTLESARVFAGRMLAHEIGHLLGLDHEERDARRLMFDGLDTKSSKDYQARTYSTYRYSAGTMITHRSLGHDLAESERMRQYVNFNRYFRG